MLVLFQDHHKEERNEELKGATTTKTRKKKKKKKRELPIAPQLPLEKHKFYEDFQFF
jgi:hypothetical protein